MDREQAHKLIDVLYDAQQVLGQKEVETQPMEQPEKPDQPRNPKPTEATKPAEKKRELPKDKRVVRTKSSGDKVYQLDDVKKTRAWITNPQVMKDLGWEMGDVKETSDADLLKYQMIAAIHRVEK